MAGLNELPLDQRLRLWADELRSIANEGLYWSGDNPYDTRRYQRLLRIAAELCAVQDACDADQVEHSYRGDLGHVAPYPVDDAAIFDHSGRILLIQRIDNGLWALPGGAFAVGETPAEGACREAWEETGLTVVPIALSDVYDSRLCGSRTLHHLYMFVFLCRPCDKHAQPIVTDETLDVGWYAQDTLPPRDPGHGQRIADAFRRWQGELREAVFDGARTSA